MTEKLQCDRTGEEKWHFDFLKVKGQPGKESSRIGEGE